MEPEENEFAYSDCLLRVRDGNAAAARELVHALHPMVMRIIHTHRPAVVAAEDIAQEVFMRVFSRLHQYQARAPFHHWVARIATLACLEQRRRAWVRREISWADLTDAQQATLQAAEPSPPTRDTPRDAAGLVRLLLDTLPPAQRLILTLLDLEERPVAEIASLTGWSASRIKVTAWRARRRLARTATRLHLREPSP